MSVPSEDVLVSVVVPAYNAAATLDETLRSVRGQTHRRLDIVVVDDGSRDATAEVAQNHVQADPRVRLIRQQNAGVAAARNTGWRAAHADYIALIDSDDLWAPRMIEKTLAAMLAGGARIGMSYCYFVKIDAGSMAPPYPTPAPHEGDVLDAILLHNFIGCGSTMLTRREALAAVEGFDDSLRARGAQGCDDYLFCCRVAEKFHYACVPEVLVGYRVSLGGVSSAVGRMLRSWMLAADQLLASQPGKRQLILQGLYNYAEWLLGVEARARRLGNVRIILWLLARYRPGVFRRIMADCMPRLTYDLAVQAKRRTLRRLRGRVASPPPLTRFPVGDVPPDAGLT